MSQSESKSTINDLRQFRLQKPLLQNRTERVPGKKRIQVMADSDSDNAEILNTPKKIKIVLTTKEKEERFLAASRISPEYDTMDIQDGLVQNDWSISECVRHLKEKCKPKQKGASLVHKNVADYASKFAMSSTSTANGHSFPKQLSVKTASSSHAKHCSDGDDSDDDVKQTQDQVYDSEESDNESSFEMTKQRRSVFNFLNSSTLHELQTIRSCSEKKASAILELRPFKTWQDLRSKLEDHKLLSADLLNNCQELINKQNNVANILRKCNKMVKKLELAIETGGGIVEQPKLLNSSLELADYQMVGLNWLSVMHNQKMNGILADEMGLGKTIQVIAFLAYLKEHNLAKKAHLIVVPASTLNNWEAEINKWCPSLVVEIYHGSQEERRRMRFHYAKEGFKGFDVLLTTYHIVGSTPEERKLFRVCKLHYVVFDEAHMLKNMTSQRYANLVTINAEMRILLTGTPVQNNLFELMSLLCFVMPSFFSKSIEDIKSLFAKKGKTESEDASHFNETQVERAKRIMKPFVLRRLKKDVLMELPAKSEYVVNVPMTEKQNQYYKDLVEYYSNNKDEVYNPDRGGVTLMMDMRKTANHPLLMRHYFTDSKVTEISKKLAMVATYKDTNSDYIFQDLVHLSDFMIWQLCLKHELDDVSIPESLICDSGKLKYLDKLLANLKKDGHRVLLFSQFTMMLDIVEEYLIIRKYVYLRLDGSTAVTMRQDMIDNFNVDSNIFIFLLSTKAGGIGINLTAADTAIIHDIDFNPYNDKQAEDRCHRLGQTRPVSIYRLISEATIEEGMLMIANEKLKLEQDIHSDKNDIQEQKCMVKLLTMALGLDEKERKKLNDSTTPSS